FRSHGDGLNTFAEVAASVRSLPGALDDIVTGAAARQQFVRAANGRSAVAGVGCCGAAVGGRAGVSRTVQELVAGAGDHRGGNVVHGDGLNTFAEVAASVGSLPGALDDIVTGAAARQQFVRAANGRSAVAEIG